AAGKGTALVLEAEGEDAEAALAALCALIDNRFDEEE
ncbi:MAG TPA: HPr family phosphocarrier protein, partial [Halieaceae bacterium]|nr:HPr family phosphocarrier protein [Halieaceae bacterium]